MSADYLTIDDDRTVTWSWRLTPIEDDVAVTIRVADKCFLDVQYTIHALMRTAGKVKNTLVYPELIRCGETGAACDGCAF